ncbi:aa3-type cytochrome c oxidase subunit IV [Sphingomonas koreensis]|nr:aa3-type cytochrome c oxidase subunit IV [Sphingomonas koreensis]MDC7811052.1 aa3-type cytochrome c oxidase subunit IV [Sphingomonas koreensis]
MRGGDTPSNEAANNASEGKLRMAHSADMKAHENTYGGFMRMMKIGTIVTVIIAAFVVWLIAS